MSLNSTNHQCISLFARAFEFASDSKLQFTSTWAKKKKDTGLLWRLKTPHGAFDAAWTSQRVLWSRLFSSLASIFSCARGTAGGAPGRSSLGILRDSSPKEDQAEVIGLALTVSAIPRESLNRPCWQDPALPLQHGLRSRWLRRGTGIRFSRGRPAYPL